MGGCEDQHHPVQEGEGRGAVELLRQNILEGLHQPFADGFIYPQAVGADVPKRRGHRVPPLSVGPRLVGAWARAERPCGGGGVPMTSRGRFGRQPDRSEKQEAYTDGEAASRAVLMVAGTHPVRSASRPQVLRPALTRSPPLRVATNDVPVSRDRAGANLLDRVRRSQGSHERLAMSRRLSARRCRTHQAPDGVRAQTRLADQQAFAGNGRLTKPRASWRGPRRHLLLM